MGGASVEAFEPAAISAIIGFVGGLVLGLAARIGRFCTLSAIEDAVFVADYRRLRMWGLAIAVAITGVAGLQAAGLFAPEHSFYLNAPPSLLATILGGLIFGFGMALVGTCGFGALARMGGGDLRGFIIVLTLAVSAAMAMHGATAIARAMIFEPSSADVAIENASLAYGLAAIVGVQPWAVAGAVGIALAAYLLRDRAFRATPRYWFWGAASGLAVVFAWASTEHLAAETLGATSVESFTFVGPVADTLLYVMTMSGSQINFGVGAVAGVLVGSAIGALSKGEFRWEACDDPRELRRQLLGAFLMGTGGVLSLGCTIGQGLSAASLLAVSAPIALLSMFAGAWIGLQYLVQGSLTGPLRAILRDALSATPK